MVFVTDAGEVRFGAQTFVDSFSNKPLSAGGGLRMVDVSVPGKGFVARDGERFKILCTYDGISNATKIYINDKLRGIADPRMMGQFKFKPFYNITGNLHEKVTLGNSIHSDGANEFAEDLSTLAEMYADPAASERTPDGTFPGIGHYAVYAADPLYEGIVPTQFFLPWRGAIHEVYLYFDNGLHEGIRYPSTCVQLEPSEPEYDDFTDFAPTKRRLHSVDSASRTHVRHRTVPKARIVAH